MHKLAECMNKSHYKTVASAPLSHQNHATATAQKITDVFVERSRNEVPVMRKRTEVVVERSRNQNGGGDE